MSDDASLTEFTGGDDTASGDSTGDDGVNGDDASKGEPAAAATAEAVDEPTFTYTSTPDGAECDACSETVEERWHAGEGGTAEHPDLSPDALVCPDCKEW